MLVNVAKDFGFDVDQATQRLKQNFGIRVVQKKTEKLMSCSKQSANLVPLNRHPPGSEPCLPSKKLAKVGRAVKLAKTRSVSRKTSSFW